MAVDAECTNSHSFLYNKICLTGDCKTIEVSILHRNPFLKEPFMKKRGALQYPLPLGFFVHGQQDLQIVGVSKIGMVAVDPSTMFSLLGATATGSERVKVLQSKGR